MTEYRKREILNVLWIVIVIVCAVGIAIWLTGCTSTGITNGKWSFDTDRLLNSTDFDKADITIDSNGWTNIKIERFSSDSQRLMDMMESMLKAGVGVKVIEGGI